MVNLNPEYNPNTRQFKRGSEFDNPLVQELNKDAQIAMNKYMSLDKKNRGRTFKTFKIKKKDIPLNWSLSN